MKKFKIANAFSINMLTSHPHRLVAVPCSLAEAQNYLNTFDFESAVGHADTARVFSALLGVEIPMNRTNLSLDENDFLLVGQYSGPRLPEGATQLPDGAAINWWIIVTTRTTDEDASKHAREFLEFTLREAAHRGLLKTKA